MKSFSERNPFVVGAIGTALTVAVVVGALQFQNLPLINTRNDYSGYFADAGGLLPGAPVQVSGIEVGKVDKISLDGPRVLVDFSIERDIQIGDRSEAAIKTKSVLGAKILEVAPRGTGTLQGPIPLDRTTAPYQLPDALGDLASTVDDLNMDQVSNSLAVLADTFRDTPPDVQVAVQGVTRFSRVLNERDARLRDLLANARKVTGVLGKRADQVVSLVANANALLVELRGQSIALDQVSSNISAVSRQIGAFIDENQQTLRPALDKLNGVLTIVDNRKQEVQKSLDLLTKYAMSLGESVGSGPFFKAYLANLVPGQFIQPFIDAAFSDLGLDPNVLLPSQMGDPPLGQRATPAMPIPYPRTGQGGEPRLTVPDAITGNPGDQGCGPPGLPLPGPTGCYPYRAPLPAPPPGGPPPGPPAPIPPEIAYSTAPTPSPVLHLPDEPSQEATP